MGSIRAHHGWRSGVYPFIFSILQCFSRSENVKFFVFFRKCPKVVVLLQPKTKQKGFRAYIDTLQTAHTSEERSTRPYI